MPTPARAPFAPGQDSNGSKASSAAPSQQQYSPEEVASQAKDLQEEVLRLQHDVRNSEFFRNFKTVFLGVEEPVAEAESREGSSTSGRPFEQDRWHWSSVKQLVSYGLGSPRKSVASRYQLGFALLLAELLPGLTEPLSTYDPAFDDVDKALLSNLGVAVHATDEQCARVAHEPTLFYMPHCITAGYGNLLRANASCLNRVAIFGNSFLGYRVAWKIGRSEREEIQEILELMEEGRVRESAIDERDMEGISDRAFYRHSLHLFRSSR
ncbi:g7503 [Coccomyxa viridis]|uniref:G7503 protein n=1 Tax=Coccomyxa viridis TaxID=1274662 RepID=A0ABP1G0K3_9CHLO